MPEKRVAWAVGFTEAVLRYLTALLLPEGGAPKRAQALWRNLNRPTLGTWALAVEELAKVVLTNREAAAWPAAAALVEPDGEHRPLLRALDVLIDVRNQLGHDAIGPDFTSDLAQELYEGRMVAALGEVAKGLAFVRDVVVHALDADAVAGPRLLSFMGPETEDRALNGSPTTRIHEPFLLRADGRVVELGPLLSVRPRDGGLRLVLLDTWADQPAFLDPVGRRTEPARHWLARWPARPDLPLPAPHDDPCVQQAWGRVAHRLEGALIANRFQVGRLIAQGGSAAVYEADDAGRPVALKILHSPLQASALHRRRLRREVEMLRRLTHPQVVRLVDFLEASEHGPLLVMELGHGVDLARLFGQDRASVSHAARVAQQLLDILAELHAEGIWHRDIKPANILLDGDRLTLVDFGIARDSQQTSMTGRLDRLGTRAFAAPEQLDEGEGGPAADLFAVGRVVTWLVTGESTEEAVSDLPMGLQAWVRRATRPAPADRFESAREMALDLASRQARDFNGSAPLSVGDEIRGLYRVVEEPTRSTDGLWRAPVIEIAMAHRLRLDFLAAVEPGVDAWRQRLATDEPDRLVVLDGLDGIVGAVYRDRPTPAVAAAPVDDIAAIRLAGFQLRTGSGRREVIPSEPVYGMRLEDAPDPGRDGLLFDVLLLEALVAPLLQRRLDLAGWFERLAGAWAPLRVPGRVGAWLEALASNVGCLDGGEDAAAALVAARAALPEEPQRAARVVFALLQGMVHTPDVSAPGVLIHGGPALLMDARTRDGARLLVRGGRVIPIPSGARDLARSAWRDAALRSLPGVTGLRQQQTFDVGIDASHRPVVIIGFEEHLTGAATTRPFVLRAGGFIQRSGIRLIGLTDGCDWRWLRPSGLRSYVELPDPRSST
ncbi:MAG: serine/threonine protein kinase [Myxococcales bacterium]|nr:serine/threonine protein kinase [Myxococcales bacterium]